MWNSKTEGIDNEICMLCQLEIKNRIVLMDSQVAFFLLGTSLILIDSFAGAAVAGSSSDVKFSYSGATGPASWGGLSVDYATCKTGKSQSPIDIVTDKAVPNAKLKPLQRKYTPTNATLINHGYNIEMKFSNAGLLIVDGKNYTLAQMHWHAPSEHTINGVLYDAELHLVHKASDDSLTVIAILYKNGEADPILAEVESKLAELAKEKCCSDEEPHIDVGTFPVWKMRRNTRKYYRYVGSLTTPPCTENVLFHVFPKVRSISKGQIEALKAPLLDTCKANNRPVQPLNGRKVELFDELN